MCLLSSGEAGSLDFWLNTVDWTEVFLEAPSIHPTLMAIVGWFFCFVLFCFFFKYKHTMTERMGKKAIVNVSKFLEDGRQMVITRRVADKAEG